MHQLPDIKELRKRIYKRSFWEFFKAAFPHIKGETYEPAWYQEKLCNELQEVGLRLAAGLTRDKHLTVNVPPRSAKSSIISVLFPVWLWLHKPNAEILTVTSTIGLASGFIELSVKVIKSPWFQELFGDVFTLVKSNETTYTNNYGGTREAFGIKTAALGKNADLILADDVLDTDTAASDLERNRALNKFRKTFLGRFNKRDVGVMINVQQRLHIEDVTGWLLENMAEYFRQIKLPSEAKDASEVSPPEWFAYYQNGLIWDSPGRFSLADLKLAKAILGSKDYAQQHLQKPLPDEGGMLKTQWFQVIPQQDFAQLTRGQDLVWDFDLDTAYTAKAQNDPSAYLVSTLVDNVLYIRSAGEVRLEAPQLLRFISKLADENGYNEHSRLFIEPKASGKTIAQLIRAETSLNVVEAPAPATDKVTRVAASAPFVESRRVVLLQGAWNDSFLTQCTGFPNAPHDDMVDCLTQRIARIQAARPQRKNYVY